MELANTSEVQCLLYERSTKETMSEKMIHRPGVLRKVAIIVIMLSSKLVCFIQYAGCKATMFV